MLIPSRSPATTLISDSGGEGLRRAAGTPPSPPVISSVTIDNTSPTVGDTLTASVMVAPAAIITFQWHADGVDIAGETNLQYVTTRVDAMGHAITVTAIATNAGGTSAPDTSLATSAVTGAPENTVAPFNVTNALGGGSGPISVANNETAGLDSEGGNTGNVGTWTGFPVQAFMTFTFLWNDGAATTAINCTPQPGDIGNSLKCTVSASNGVGSPVPADSNAIAVTA